MASERADTNAVVNDTVAIVNPFYAKGAGGLFAVLALAGKEVNRRSTATWDALNWAGTNVWDALNYKTYVALEYANAWSKLSPAQDTTIALTPKDAAAAVGYGIVGWLLAKGVFGAQGWLVPKKYHRGDHLAPVKPVPAAAPAARTAPEA